MPPKKKGQRMDLQDFLLESSGNDTGSWADDEISLSNLGADPWGAPSASGSTGWSATSFAQPVIPNYPPFTARLTSLSYEATEESVRDFFASRGFRVTSVRLPKDMETGRIKGSAFVDFDDRDGLVGAMKLDNVPLQGRPVHIGVAEQREGDRSDGNWRSGPRGGGPRAFRDEPELDWGAARRSGPPPGAPPTNAPGLARFARVPPAEDDLDWGSRRGPYMDGPPRHRPPPQDDNLDWGAARRAGPPPSSARRGSGHGSRRMFSERPHRDEPELDWGAARRHAPPPADRHAKTSRRHHHTRREEPDLDWAKDRPVSSHSPTGVSASAQAPQSSSESSVKPEGTKSNLGGFAALRIDDDEDDDESSSEVSKKAGSAVDPDSIASVADAQKAQRAQADGGTWSTAGRR